MTDGDVLADTCEPLTFGAELFEGFIFIGKLLFFDTGTLRPTEAMDLWFLD